MSQFICLAEFIARPGKVQELIDHLSLLISPTTQEKGCISYALHQDLHQSEKLTMIEIFKSKEDFDFHSTQPYIDDFKKVADSLILSSKKTFGLTKE